MAFLLVEDVYEQWSFSEPFSLGPIDPAVFALPGDCKASC
jgi:hypothetical protein